MNHKGDFTGYVYFFVFIFISAVLFTVIAYVFPPILEAIKSSQIGASIEANNSIDASITIASSGGLYWSVLFIILFVGLCITAYYTPASPGFAVLFIVLVLIMIPVSAVLSNVFESLQTSELGGDVSNTGLLSVSLRYLPLIAAVVGLVIMVIAYAKGGNYDTSLG